ncbi:MAG: DNA translocase FtsK 4TM domain-containing protein [Pyrinomonadaceae bacterium]|nr:DNA translocase FtsK 4TM domain-containing protein [Pyrinomonadaceae bacterium]
MAVEVEKRIASKTHSRSSEIVALILLALAVLVFLCLLTNSPDDWSWNSTGRAFSVKSNWIGIVGAIISDALLQIIGLTAYFLPALIALMAWRFYRPQGGYVSFSRIIGYGLFIVSTASLFDLFGWRGGMLGAFFGKNFAWLFSGIGAGILLTAIFAASLLMITKLSFLSLSDKLEMPIENLKMRLNGMLERRRLAAEISRREAKEQQEREEKHAAKILAAKPIISAGEVSANFKEKPAAKENSPSIFDRFNKQPVAEEAAEKPSVAEEFEFDREKPEETEETENIEKAFPTISVSEEIEKPFASPVEIGAIPITPIRETGELDAEILEEIEESEELPAQSQKSQNYDDYVLPTTDFLTQQPPRIEQKDEQLLAIAQELTDKTKEFNVTGRVMHICQGPVVTTYEFKPDPGVKYSRVTGLSDDLCLALKAESIRIDRIPGKAFVGIEVPNQQRETIFLREVIESKKFRESKSLLTIALGKTIDGLNYVADLAKMPHLLIAGATGAGKSVGVNTLVVSILYKAKPDEVKFIMVDPKRLELGLYADIPHLATPIITDPKRAAISLKWAVSQMEKRYKDLAGWGVRNIDGFNAEVEKRTAAEQFDDNGEPYKKLPYIVIIIDELADLMMVSSKEVEESITRLAQMARAVGIHLVLATQRPSVDVITGLIKANFPSRISFRVSSKVDSRTIIDGNGSEQLLGKGDMLFLPPGTSQIIRVHGAFVDEKEITRIVSHINAQGKPDYDTTITKTEEEMVDSDDLPGKRDPLFPDALRTVATNKSASTSLLQRHLRIGYGRAAAILDAMVREGYIGEMDGSKRARPILQKAFDDLQEAEEGREL